MEGEEETMAKSTTEEDNEALDHPGSAEEDNESLDHRLL
jgi:hypothetical protein